MKNRPRPKKLTLQVETLRLLDADQLEVVNGGSWALTTTIFSEGACEGYSWAKACPEQPVKKS